MSPIAGDCCRLMYAYMFQAHDTAVRSMVWSHNDQWMLTGDHGGYVKYWQSNMNNVKMYQAHKDPIRGLRCVTTRAKRSWYLTKHIAHLYVFSIVSHHSYHNLASTNNHSQCHYLVSISQLIRVQLVSLILCIIWLINNNKTKFKKKKKLSNV